MSLPDNSSKAREDFIETIGMLVADLGWLEHAYTENEPVTRGDLSMWERDFQKDADRVLGFVNNWQREVG